MLVVLELELTLFVEVEEDDEDETEPELDDEVLSDAVASVLLEELDQLARAVDELLEVEILDGDCDEAELRLLLEVEELLLD